ncbi:MAG TPA: TorF family putative porin [Bacteroidota bacterium]|nr:TorF family putative porin [Bacteroidota bacterium]
MNTTRFLLLVLLCCEFASAQVDDKDAPWSASAGLRFMNRYTSYGVDLSNDQPALAPSFALDHDGGFNAGFESIVTMGSNGGLQRWSISAGYELSVSNVLSLSADFTHYRYQNDTANVLAGLSNSISLSADMEFEVVSLSANVHQYLGDLGATYFGFDASGFVEFGDLMIVPLAQITFVSQEVSISRTKPGGMGRKSGPTSSSTVTLTGISSMSLHAIAVYPLAEGLSITIHPAIVYSPKAEVSTRSTQFAFSLGARYSFPF